MVPWLLGSGYGEVDPQLRKALEVALHAGALAGLAIGLGEELRGDLHELDRRHVLVLALGSAPAGAAGVALERQIESALGTPSTIAAGLLIGAVALGLADRAPEERRSDEAGTRDALWLGLAQACALVPGISRGGATLAAARFRCFRRADAARLSRELSWPVIAGATLLKSSRLRHRSELGDCAPALGAGALGSFLSVLAACRLARGSHAARPLLPYALYRAGLAALILARLRRDRA